MRQGYYADLDSSRVTLSRAELMETRDDGDFQLVTAKGMDSEVFRFAGRSMPFGFGSHAPPGSIGHVLSVAGRRDQAWLLGLEHPDHRRRQMPVGTTALYNQFGDIIKVFEHMVEVVTQTFKVKASTIIFEGDIQITGNISQAGNFAQAGQHIDSNGKHS